jgi:hypothetical protein
MSQSPYIVNIVELQNVVTNVQGTNTAANIQSLQTAVENLQQMVLFDTKTIAVDVLSNFTASNSITVAANMNFSNATLFSNGTEAYLNTGTSISATSGTTTAGSFSTLSVSSLISLGANISTISVSSLFATYAFIENLYQPSDQLLKTKLETFSTTVTDVLQLQPKRFEWRASGKADFGFIAQEVQLVWPELVSRDPRGSLNLEYSKFVPLLLESIRELKARVEVLEKRVL